MKKIAIFGAGGFGREVHSLIQHINYQRGTYNFIGYFDDGVEKGTEINHFPVLGGIKELNLWDGDLGIVLAIGNPNVKQKILSQITNTFVTFPKLIHPSVIIGEIDSTIGEGSIICAGVIITVNTSIGKHVILNLSCTVGHDTIIEDFCSFMPTVNISGEVIIRRGVYVGTGVKIINQLEIGDYSIIGAGAVVAKSLPPHCTAVGIPAKPIKFHNQN